MTTSNCNKMQMVQYRNYSTDLQELEVVRVGKPVPGVGQVLVRVFVAAGNQVDLYLYYGMMRSNRWRMAFPFTPGYDFSGVIDSVGGDVTNFEIGDEVFGVNWGYSRHDNAKDPTDPLAGSFSEYMLIYASKLSRKPRRVPFGVAAALGSSGSAAYQCVHDIGYVGKGCRVLILGGSTMVGCLAIQLSKLYGAWVATTCSSRTHDFVEQYSPDLIVHYDTDKWYQHPDVHGLDFILDVADDKKVLEILKESDHMIKVGAAFISLTNPLVGSDSKAHPPFSHARFYCFHQSTQDQDYLMELVEEDKLKVPIFDHFPFTKRGVVEIFEALHGRKATGKLLLRLD